MPLISERDQQTLRDVFDKRMKDDVEITYFTQGKSTLSVPSLECEYCSETHQLLNELTQLTGSLRLSVKDFVGDEAEAKRRDIARIPAFVIEGHAKGKVRFFGVPSGYEFSAVIEDLLDVSTGSTDLSPESRQALAKLDKDVHIQVFVTPT